MKGFLELVYYFVGFFAADIIINLLFGNDIDLVGSLIGTIIFMSVYVMLMLGWRGISKKISRD